MAPPRILSSETDGRTEVVRCAADALARGRIVALPTETVYGLGVRQDSSEALQALRDLKGRAEDKALTIMVAEPSHAEKYVPVLPPGAEMLMEVYWPGPLTLVLPDGAGGTVGLRCPADEITREILARVEAPVVVTSANRSGEDPAARAEDVAALFDEGLECIVDGGPSDLGQASTVLSIEENGVWTILRAGIVDEEALLRRLCQTILFVCTGNTCRSAMAEAIAKKLVSERFGVPLTRLPSCGFRFRSAGLFAQGGAPATRFAQTAAKELGADLRAHRAQPVTQDMIEEATQIYAMTEGHLAGLLHIDPECEAKASLLDPDEKSLRDPFGGPEEEYRACAAKIQAALSRRLELPSEADRSEPGPETP